MPRYCPRCGEALHSHSTTKGEVRKTARRAYEPKKTKRAPSAYHRRYSAAFKQVSGRYKTKAGKWKKDGFKRAAAAARKIAKRG
jgi:DNA-directed RNA polymerase subunit M/transcription elongation factor TFIIS